MTHRTLLALVLALTFCFAFGLTAEETTLSSAPEAVQSQNVTIPSAEPTVPATELQGLEAAGILPAPEFLASPTQAFEECHWGAWCRNKSMCGHASACVNRRCVCL